MDEVWKGLLQQGPLVLLMMGALWALVVRRAVYTAGYVETVMKQYEQRITELREYYDARLTISERNCNDWKQMAQESAANLAALTKIVEANEVAEWERENRAGGRRPPPGLGPKTPKDGDGK